MLMLLNGMKQDILSTMRNTLTKNKMLSKLQQYETVEINSFCLFKLNYTSNISTTKSEYLKNEFEIII